MSTPSLLSALAAAGTAAEPEAPPACLQFLPLVAMGVIFWLLIIRPQMRRQKEHQAKVASLKKGDQVVTAGGLIGKVLKVDDHYVDLELGQGVKVKAVKATIGDIIPPAGASPAND